MGVDIEIKICTKCKTSHPKTSEFFWRDAYLKDGFQYVCKECCKKKYIPHPIIRDFANKVCPKCKQSYPRTLDYFYKTKEAIGGIGGICKKCHTEQTNKWGETHIDKVRLAKSKYKKTHIEKVRESENKRRKIKYKEDPNFKMRSALSGRLRKVLKNNSKSDKTINLLGCDIPSFVLWIESQFKEDMSWENYGYNGWHLDHIRPCGSFNLADPIQQKECFHYTNFQPLWRDENQNKGSVYKGYIYWNGEILKKKIA